MPKLVNLGSLCIDHVYRVPNLAGSGETVSASSHSLFAGGKGLNQSLAAAAAGAAVAHFGCVGDDGQFLIDELSKVGVAVGGIRRVAVVTERLVPTMVAVGLIYLGGVYAVFRLS